jgi:hypothetical protein
VKYRSTDANSELDFPLSLLNMIIAINLASKSNGQNLPPVIHFALYLLSVNILDSSIIVEVVVMPFSSRVLSINNVC